MNRSAVRQKQTRQAASLLAVFLMAALLFGISFPMSAASQPDQFANVSTEKAGEAAEQAVIDYQGASLQDLGLLTLSGNWEFYWNQLLTPEDFTFFSGSSSTALANSQRLIKAELGWRQIPDLPDQMGSGAATYRLVLKNLSHDGHLGLKKTNIRNASKIYINGELISQDGHPSLEPALYIAGNVPQTVYFETDAKDLEIIVQVSDYSLFQGGFGRAIQIGTQQNVMTHNTQQFSFELITSLILLLIALSHALILLNMYLTKIASTHEFNQFSLILMLVFFIFALQNTLINERVLYQLIPKLSYAALLTIAQVCQLMLSVLLLLTFYQFNQRLISKTWLKITAAVSAILLLLLISPWPETYYRFVFLPSFLFYSLMFLILVRAVLVAQKPSQTVAQRHERIGTVVLISLIILYGLSSLSYQSGFIHNMILAQLSALAVATTMLYLFLNRMLAISHERNRVQAELKFQQAEAVSREMDFLRAQINPHFIYNALSVIISLCVTEPPKASKLLNDLSTYLRGSFDFKRLSHTATLAHELNLLNAYVEIEKARFGQRLSVIIDVDKELLSRSVPPLLIQPLVENAIRHGVLHRESGGCVRLSIRAKGEGLVIEIHDDGQGMPPEKIQAILYPSVAIADLKKTSSDFAKSATPELERQNSGIALGNIVHRLREQYHSDLQIKSQFGQGTTLTIELP